VLITVARRYLAAFRLRALRSAQRMQKASAMAVLIDLISFFGRSYPGGGLGKSASGCGIDGSPDTPEDLGLKAFQ